MEELRRTTSRWRSWRRQLSAIGNIHQCSEAETATQFVQFPGITREIVPCFEYMDGGSCSSRLSDGIRHKTITVPASQRYHSVNDMLSHFRTMSGSSVLAKILDIVGDDKHHLAEAITASILTRLLYDAEKALICVVIGREPFPIRQVKLFRPDLNDRHCIVVSEPCTDNVAASVGALVEAIVNNHPSNPMPIAGTVYVHVSNHDGVAFNCGADGRSTPIDSVELEDIVRRMAKTAQVLCVVESCQAVAVSGIKGATPTAMALERLQTSGEHANKTRLFRELRAAWKAWKEELHAFADLSGKLGSSTSKAMEEAVQFMASEQDHFESLIESVFTKIVDVNGYAKTDLMRLDLYFRSLLSTRHVSKPHKHVSTRLSPLTIYDEVAESNVGSIALVSPCEGCTGGVFAKVVAPSIKEDTSRWSPLTCSSTESAFELSG